jgi:hypothetical protein
MYFCKFRFTRRMLFLHTSSRKRTQTASYSLEMHPKTKSYFVPVRTDVRTSMCWCFGIRCTDESDTTTGTKTSIDTIGNKIIHQC